MIGLIWNCRGVTKKGLAPFLKELIWDHNADFISLQETIRKSYSDKFFRSIDPNKNFAWHWIPATGRSGGILCGIKLENFDVVSFEAGNFAIMAKVVDRKTQQNMTLISVYGPAHDDKKDQFLTELSRLCTSNPHPLLIGGDFNILRFSSEKNKAFRGNKFSDLFNMLINTFGLRDLGLNGGKYTWSNNQRNPTLERLDRVFINDKWEQIFPLSSLRKIPRYMSDHNPLILSSDQTRTKKTKAFCFETSWIKHHDFSPKIKEIWEKPINNKDAIDTWCIKINRVKKFLKGWGQSLRGHTKKYRKILQDELEKLELLEELQALPPVMLDRKTFIQTELLKLLEEEESYWHKRSSLNWLLKGDNNTEFFHRVANGKKKEKHNFLPPK